LSLIGVAMRAMEVCYLYTWNVFHDLLLLILCMAYSTRAPGSFDPFLLQHT
jgi:hypothetical protein